MDWAAHKNNCSSMIFVSFPVTVFSMWSCAQICGVFIWKFSPILQINMRNYFCVSLVLCSTFSSSCESPTGFTNILLCPAAACFWCIHPADGINMMDQFDSWSVLLKLLYSQSISPRELLLKNYVEIAYPLKTKGLCPLYCISILHLNE